MLSRKFLVFFAIAFSICSEAPVEWLTRPAHRGNPGELAVLPGGRQITPIGDEYQTGPGTFGLALSPDGSRVATADGGPNYFSVTLFNTSGKRW